MQAGAELGIPGVGFLLLFYGVAMSKAIRLRLDRTDAWNRTAAQIVITGLTGFIVAAQFVSLEGLELPFHLVLVCAATLKLSSAAAPATTLVTAPAAAPAYPASAMRPAAPMRATQT